MATLKWQVFNGHRGNGKMFYHFVGFSQPLLGTIYIHFSFEIIMVLKF
jgi:hypothetical protein